MCHCDWIWHIFFCLICCISKHHSLISGTDCFDLVIRHLIFFCFQCLVYSKSDIRRLLIQCCDDTTCLCIESVFSSCISNLTNCVANDFLDIYVSVCCNFSHNHNETCCCTCLTRYTAHWVLFQ